MINVFNPSVDADAIQSVVQVLQSGWISQGKITEQFEELIAQETNTKYAVACSSGTVALYMALRVLDVPKKEIITTDYSFIAPASAIETYGAEVKLVDIDNDLTINPNLSLSKDTSAIIWVHFNGYIKKIPKFNIPIIEDMACCAGQIKELQGDIGCISLSTPKMITSSQGGVCITNNKDLYIRLKQLRDHKNGKGFNFKFNDILASIALSQLKKLPQKVSRKKEIISSYEKTNLNLTSYNDFPWVVMATIRNPKEFIEHLEEKGIKAQRLYKPIHLTYPQKGNFIASDYASEHIVSLPSYLKLSDKDLEYINKVIFNYDIKTSKKQTQNIRDTTRCL